ncbi:unnamed protein product, partial [Lampetra fluviatilis]
ERNPRRGQQHHHQQQQQQHQHQHQQDQQHHHRGLDSNDAGAANSASDPSPPSPPPPPPPPPLRGVGRVADRFLVEPRAACLPPGNSPPPFLLILVLSRRSEAEARTAVRETWGRREAQTPRPQRHDDSDDNGDNDDDSDRHNHHGSRHRPPPQPLSSHSPYQQQPPPLTVSVVFLLGSAKADGTDTDTTAEDEALMAESSLHDDLLVGAYVDSYANLTLKTVRRSPLGGCALPPGRLRHEDRLGRAGQRAAADAGAAGAVAAADVVEVLVGAVVDVDVVVVDVVVVVVVVVATAGPLGGVGRRFSVSPSLYPPARLPPPYCSGSGYLLSRDAAAAVASASRRVPPVRPEDAYVGLCARALGLRPLEPASLRLFSAGLPSSGGGLFGGPPGCAYSRVLTAHGLRPAEMRAAWAAAEAAQAAPGRTWRCFAGDVAAAAEALPAARRQRGAGRRGRAGGGGGGGRRGD